MPFEDTKILGVNHYQNSNKAPFIINAGLELLRKKVVKCKKNHENLSTKRK